MKTKTDKIKKLAILDGWTDPAEGNFGEVYAYSSINFCREEVPNYLTSFDAIIPLVKKLWIQSKITATQFDEIFRDLCVESAERVADNLLAALTPAAQEIRECPHCKLPNAVIEDGYCCHCRQCTLPPITVAEPPNS